MSGEFTGLERRKRAAKQKGGGMGVIGLVLGLIVAGVVTIGVGYAVWVGVTSPPVKQFERVSRDEFRKSLLGKSPEEVLKALGKPASADEPAGEDKHAMWLYTWGKTFDPVSQTTDNSMFIYFERGKVVNVRY